MEGADRAVRFNSSVYVLFLVVVVLAVWLTPARARRWVLLGFSYLFYASWHWPYLGLLIGLATINHWGAQWIVAGPPNRKWRGGWVLAANVFLLGLFKYSSWLCENVNAVADWTGAQAILPVPHWILPLGISFYVFEGISYTVDIIRKRERIHSFWDFQLFIAFFPKLIAGPIMRAKELLPQIEKPVTRLTSGTFLDGTWLLATGMFLKVVLADGLAPQVDQAFARPIEGVGTTDVWLMAVAFGLQIYLDFSSYSRMAIGSARLCGIQLVDNFNYPYSATSPVDFWNRWHMSLSRWIRDYLFFPLLGKSATLGAMCRAALMSMTLCGIWHGAGWPFLLWGAYHGALISGYHIVTYRKRNSAAPDAARRSQSGPPSRLAAVDFCLGFFGMDPVPISFDRPGVWLAQAGFHPRAVCLSCPVGYVLSARGAADPRGLVGADRHPESHRLGQCFARKAATGSCLLAGPGVRAWRHARIVPDLPRPTDRIHLFSVLDPAMNSPDIVSRVLNHAERMPERVCVQTHSRRVPQQQRSFAQVAEAAGRAASFYHEHGLRPGDVVVLVGTHHIDFYAAWLGCVWLGAIPTVLAEPSVRVAKEVYWARLSELLARIGAWGLAADPKLRIENSLLVVPHVFRYDQIAARRRTHSSARRLRSGKHAAVAAFLGNDRFAQGRHVVARRHLAAHRKLQPNPQNVGRRRGGLVVAALPRHGIYRLFHHAAVACRPGRLAVAVRVGGQSRAAARRGKLPSGDAGLAAQFRLSFPRQPCQGGTGPIRSFVAPGSRQLLGARERRRHAGFCQSLCRRRLRTPGDPNLLRHGRKCFRRDDVQRRMPAGSAPARPQNLASRASVGRQRCCRCRDARQQRAGCRRLRAENRRRPRCARFRQARPAAC